MKYNIMNAIKLDKVNYCKFYYYYREICGLNESWEYINC